MSSTATPVIRLYPGRAPGSENATQQEIVLDMPNWFGRAAFNVTEPTLTVYTPAPGTANGAAVVICPGGGFVGLSIDNEGASVAQWLTARGLTCFVLKYRVLASPPDNPVSVYDDKSESQMAELAAQTLALAHTDALIALRYVRAHAADYGVDPARIGIMGFSAGGTLATSVAYAHDDHSRPDFIAPIYVHYDWSLRGTVPADAAPMFLAAATDDELGLGPHSVRLYADWVAAGKPAELHMYSRGGHGFAMRQQGLPVDGWIDLFWQWLATQGIVG